MRKQKIIAGRIEKLCRQKRISYYMLAGRSGVPMTTIMNIIKGVTKNPGIFTLLKICNGLGVTPIEFFDAEELKDIEKE